MVQMREKGLTNDTVQDYLEEARSLRALTERYKVPLIIDDNIKLALLCGADGVHVGQNDMDAAQARAGPESSGAGSRLSGKWSRIRHLHQSRRPSYDYGAVGRDLPVRFHPGCGNRGYLPGKYWKA